MVATTSMHAPSRHANICVCALKFWYHIHYVNSDLRRNFLIDGYGIFLSLRRIISYPQTMSAYDLCISFIFFFVSTLYPILYPSVSTLDSILYPPVSMLDSIYYWFDLTLTTFPTRSLLEGGPIWRVSMCVHPIITSINFVNRAPCRALVKKYTIMCSALHYAIEILLLSILSLKK